MTPPDRTMIRSTLVGNRLERGKVGERNVAIFRMMDLNIRRDQRIKKNSKLIWIMDMLHTEILDSVKRNGFSFKPLSEEEGNLLLGKLKVLFDLDFSKKYLWELGQPIRTEEYTDDWEVKIKTLLGLFNEQIFLTVTDDEFYPWNVFRGKKSDIIELILDLRFFEFFIFDNSFYNLLFDTHHNRLLLFSHPVSSLH